MAELPSFPAAPGWEWLFNRRGRLTPEQIKRMHEANGKRMLPALLLVMLLAPIFSCLDALEQSFGRNLPLVVHGMAVIAIGAIWTEICLAFIVLILVEFSVFRALIESREGRVAQIEGILRWRGRRYVVEAGARRLTLPDEIGLHLLSGPYRFYFLPKSRVVAAAEWIGEPVPFAEWLKRSPFLASALPFNRGGRCSPDQASVWILWLFGISMGLSFVALFAPLLTRGTLDIYFSMAQPVIFALIWFVFSNFRCFTDMRPGQMASVEGIIRRERRQRQNGVWVYTFTVGDLRLTVSQAAYDALDERYIYRLYYTLRGHHLLNMEPIGETASVAGGAAQT